MQRSPFVIVSNQAVQPEPVSLNNLPAPPTPLIGREHEVQQASGLLRRDDVRLVSMTGPGGVGKTRLALAVAAEVGGDFPDGVYYVPLAPIDDPTLVVSAIAQTLEVKESGDKSLPDALKTYLYQKRLLLVLDNFEQVLPAAPLVATIIAAAPAVKVLVTSRAVLHIRAEQEFSILPLPLPRKDGPWGVDTLAQNPAITLFVQRAAAVQPDFVLNDRNAPIVAEICARLDGLPLAIELAAARVKLLSLPALLARLADRLRLLTGGAQDLPLRQQTLRNTLDWSYDLLDPREQHLFRTLAIFVGGCTGRAAELVAAGLAPSPEYFPAAEAGGDLEILERIASLIDKSLLRHSAGAGGEIRFWMLETVRSHALDRLEQAGEVEEISRRHAACYCAFVESAGPLLDGPAQGLWLSRLEEEHDNVRAALAWSLRADGAATALRLARVLWRFWEIHGHLSEGRAWMEEALAAGQDQPDALRADVLHGLGRLTWAQGDYILTRHWVEQSLAISRKLGSREGIARELHALGMIMGPLHQPERAQTYYGESLALWRELGHKENIARLLISLGTAARARGDHAQAQAVIGESLALYRELDNPRGISTSLANLGFIAHGLGDDAGALALLAESLRLRLELGDRPGVVHCLLGFAGAFGGLGRQRRAARLFSVVAALCATLGYALDPEDQQVYNRDLATVRSRIEDAAFTQAWQEGQGLTLDQAVADALAPLECAPLGASPAAAPASLLTESVFGGAVQDALRNFTQPALLQRNPLVHAALVTARTGLRATGGQRAAALQSVVQEAYALLAQGPRDAKFARAIQHTYLRPAGTQEQIAEQLDLPFSTFRRHLKEGVRRITEILWEQELEQRAGLVDAVAPEG